MRDFVRSSVLLVVVCTSLACGKAEAPPTEAAGAEPATPAVRLPSAERAAEIIATSPEFSDFEFTFASFSLPMTGATSNERTSRPALDLASAGWISLDAAGNVTLPEKSANDKRFLVRPNGFVDIVPLAKKELIEVTVVEEIAGDVVATFRWRWIPNEVGGSFTSGSMYERFNATHAARATLMKQGDDWSVFLIERADPPDE